MAQNSPEPHSARSTDGRRLQPHDDPTAQALRGFGPLGVVAMLVILLAFTPALKALLVLAWAWRSHTPCRDIGYVRPQGWIRSLAIGLASGAAFKIVMKALVMPLLGAGPVNSAYHYIAGNPAALPGTGPRRRGTGAGNRPGLWICLRGDWQALRALDCARDL
jgi:hypothetical protein